MKSTLLFIIPIMGIVSYFLSFQTCKINSLEYQINNIDSIENIYIIYAQKNDSLFKIVSKKEYNPNCNKIKKGCKYILDLESSFLPEELHVKQNVAGIKYYGVTISVERNSNVVSDIFTTKNLQGLCYKANPE